MKYTIIHKKFYALVYLCLLLFPLKVIISMLDFINRTFCTSFLTDNGKDIAFGINALLGLNMYETEHETSKLLRKNENWKTLPLTILT